MVFPAGLSHKGASNQADTLPNKYTLTDAPAPKYSAGSGGLVLAIVSAIVFPFLGIPAIVFATYAYVDFKTENRDAYKRHVKNARGLTIAALVFGLVLWGGYASWRIARCFHAGHYYDYSRDGRGNDVTPGVYCHRASSDCWGRDIRHYRNIDLRHCQLECDGHPDCRSIQHVSSYCWLKHYVCSASELNTVSVLNDYVKLTDTAKADDQCKQLQDDVNTVRGVNYCQRDQVQCTVVQGHYCHRPESDCIGHDLAHFTGIDRDPCLKACDDQADCKSVQHDADYNCWLKSHVCQKNELSTRNIPEKSDYVKRSSAPFTCEGL